MTDRLRLKQVILNLGRNSSKFVHEGFIRLKAEVVDGNVELSVEDSGPGLTQENRQNLFLKFQETLDTLSQGTGIGLHLCKMLTTLMGGEIRLDDTYESGVAGCPGARFVVMLNQPPIHQTETHEVSATQFDAATSDPSLLSDQDAESIKLPEHLSVLFVDDDSLLRKLFKRAIRAVKPDWEFREAANGETALQLVDHAGILRAF